MSYSYQKNDWDSFEELQITVEYLELSQDLLRSRSHSKARAAVILLDHVADVLMYRICTHDFEWQAMIEKVVPPDVERTVNGAQFLDFLPAAHICVKQHLIFYDKAGAKNCSYD